MSTLIVSNLSDGTKTAPATALTEGTAKMWVKHSSAIINGSYNVASFTDNATGFYTIAYTNAIATSYCPTGGIQTTLDRSLGFGAPTTTQIDQRIYVSNTGAAVDAEMSFAIMGDLV